MSVISNKCIYIYVFMQYIFYIIANLISLAIAENLEYTNVFQVNIARTDPDFIGDK